MKLAVILVREIRTYVERHTPCLILPIVFFSSISTIIQRYIFCESFPNFLSNHKKIIKISVWNLSSTTCEPAASEVDEAISKLDSLIVSALSMHTNNSLLKLNCTRGEGARRHNGAVDGTSAQRLHLIINSFPIDISHPWFLQLPYF